MRLGPLCGWVMFDTNDRGVPRMEDPRVEQPLVLPHNNGQQLYPQWSGANMVPAQPQWIDTMPVAPEQPRKGSPWVVVAFSALLVVLLGLTFVFQKTLPPLDPADTMPAVRLAVIDQVEVARTRRFSGTVRARDRAELSFVINGRVASRAVELGQRVEAGDVLLQLDDEPYKIQVAAAGASVAQLSAQAGLANKQKHRAEALAQETAITEAELEQLQGSHKALSAGSRAAAAQLKEAQRMLRETELRAPFAGIVTDLLVQPGEFVSIGRPVVVIAGSDGLEVEVQVPEKIVGLLKVGATVNVATTPGSEPSSQGTIQAIGSAASHGKLFPVVVALQSNERIMPGVTVELTFPLLQEPALVVPIEALVDPRGAAPTLLCVRDGVATRVEVELVELSEDTAVVRGPITAGETIVAAGHGSVVPGEPVEAR